MKIEEHFRRESLTFSYLDPLNHFAPKEMSLEIRQDLIGEVTTRVLPYRFRLYEPPPLDRYQERAPATHCPFCLPQREVLTPRFPPDIYPPGQFTRGDVCLFPNAFPHSHHNTVAVLGNRHYVPIEELEPLLMRDGMLICRDYMAQMVALDETLQYGSINWNYMPPAGGGLLHPHLQTVLSVHPTLFMERLRSAAARYRQVTGSDLWNDYVCWERSLGERYVFPGRAWHWIVAFAPRGMAGEIGVYFPHHYSLFSLSDADYEAFCAEFAHVLKYLGSLQLVSFNFALYGAMREDPLFPIQGRLIPRYLIPPLETSDVNYFEKMHGEVICPFVPEEMAAGLRMALTGGAT